MKSKRWGIFIAVVGLLALVAISVVKKMGTVKMERDVMEFRIFPSPVSPFYARMILQAVY